MIYKYLFNIFKDLSHHKWRFIVGFNSLTSFILFLSCAFLITESPRFDLVNGRFNQAVKSINYMAKQNNNPDYLDK
jgi:hypothetical protein